jgi:hypothetical protein
LIGTLAAALRSAITTRTITAAALRIAVPLLVARTLRALALRTILRWPSLVRTTLALALLWRTLVLLRMRTILTRTAIAARPVTPAISATFAASITTTFTIGFTSCVSTALAALLARGIAILLASTLSPAFASAITRSACFFARCTCTLVARASCRARSASWATAKALGRGRCWRRCSLRHGLCEVLNRDRDLADLAIGLGDIELHEHELRQDLRIDDKAVALGRADARLLLGELLAERVVGFVFVPEAAHQPAAPAGDLERVECGLLDLGRLHADGLQDLEEVLAAAVLAAAFVICSDACLVACADLAELDAVVKEPRETRGKVAKIDAVLAVVVDVQAFIAQDRFCVHDLDRDLEFLDDALALGPDAVAGLLDRRLACDVLCSGDAQDPAIGEERVIAPTRVLDVLEHVLAADALGAAAVGTRAGEHLTDLGPAVGPNDHL